MMDRPTPDQIVADEHAEPNYHSSMQYWVTAPMDRDAYDTYVTKYQWVESWVNGEKVIGERRMTYLHNGEWHPYGEFEVIRPALSLPGYLVAIDRESIAAEITLKVRAMMESIEEQPWP